MAFRNEVLTASLVHHMPSPGPHRQQQAAEQWREREGGESWEEAVGLMGGSVRELHAVHRRVQPCQSTIGAQGW